MQQLTKGTQYPVTFSLNGQEVTGHAEPRTLLSDFLTHEIGITSCHVGCEHGVCGACTVLVDGVVSRACLTFAVQVDGTKIQTAEGLTGIDGDLTDLQKAFKKLNNPAYPEIPTSFFAP